MPLAIVGTREVMPKGRLRTEPGDVTLVVHDPIPAPTDGQATIRDARLLADRVRAIVTKTISERRDRGAVPL